jgi:hypothetical protein
MAIDDYAHAMDELQRGNAGKIVLVPWGERAALGELATASAQG